MATVFPQYPIATMSQNRETLTVITDIDIPFSRLIMIILKFMFASIPAMIIFYIIMAIFTLIVAGFVGGGVMGLQKILQH